MNTQNLPPLEFNLTPAERSQAAYAAVHLERRRRLANERDERQRRAEDARALERALEDQQ